MNPNIPSVKDIEKCPGFGFFPSEDCLVNFFLAKKNSGQAKANWNWPILEIDLCAFEPCHLLGLRTAGCDNYKYFFNKREYSDKRKQTYKRTTKTGYWKSTGNPRKIKGGGKSTKRSLSFYKKDPVRGSKSVRTGWIIQEYDNGGRYVISKLQIKDDKNKKSKLNLQNVSVDDFTKDSQIIYHDSEVQNQMEPMANHNEGETSFPMSPVQYKNSFSTDSGEEYQSPAISSDLEYYNNDMTANYLASQDSETVLTNFVDQNGKDMNVAMLSYQEGFSSETENQISNNESEGEWSPITPSPYNSFSNESIFGGEGVIFSPYSDWNLQNDPATTSLDQSDWWSNMVIFS